MQPKHLDHQIQAIKIYLVITVKYTKLILPMIVPDMNELIWEIFDFLYAKIELYFYQNYGVCSFMLLNKKLLLSSEKIFVRKKMHIFRTMVSP